MKKITAALMLFALVLTAVCICGDDCSASDDAAHCFVCCGASDHGFLPDRMAAEPLLAVSGTVLMQDSIVQQYFACDIEHPPKVSS